MAADPSTEPLSFAEEEMMALAGRAIQRVDLLGRRGTSLVTYEEVEAMAALIVCLGHAPACKRAFLRRHEEQYKSWLGQADLETRT